MKTGGRMDEIVTREAAVREAARPGRGVPRLLGRAEFAGRAASVSGSRSWARSLLRGILADDELDDLLVLLSEVVTNSILYTRSGSSPDGRVTVCLTTGGGAVRVEVTDDGSDTSVPTIRESADDCACGRGLWLVDRLAMAWGAHLDHERGGTVWFEIAGVTGQQSDPRLLNRLGYGDAVGDQPGEGPCRRAPWLIDFDVVAVKIAYRVRRATTSRSNLASPLAWGGLTRHPEDMAGYIPPCPRG
ncbi:ATP-binding protein [Sphaerimonospora cavernae]|uniref:ATP-binding protein n=1 Tax=Sphaerimonospora cavernae TaxID=1740611 RepID=A0ABV6UCD7_9ACTN